MSASQRWQLSKSQQLYFQGQKVSSPRDPVTVLLVNAIGSQSYKGTDISRARDRVR